MARNKDYSKSNKAMIYRKMQLVGINSRLKENRVEHVSVFNNREENEKGWNFITQGGNKGRVVIGKPLEYAGKVWQPID